MNPLIPSRRASAVSRDPPMPPEAVLRDGRFETQCYALLLNALLRMKVDVGSFFSLFILRRG